MPEGGGPAIAFMVAFMMVYDTISTTNSSPQTTEINASVRAESLMKWVKLGLAQAAVIAAIAIAMEQGQRSRQVAIGSGAGLAIGFLWVQYVHAKNAGLSSNAPGTETPGGWG